MSLKVARLCRPGRVTARRLLGHYCRAFSEVARQNGGGFGRGGFGPKARAVSRCGRPTLDRASCRAYSLSPSSLYWGLVSDAIKATRSSNTSGWAFASSTAGGSSGHPGVTRFRYTQRYLGPMTHSVEGNPRLSLRGSDCDDSQVVGALT